MPNLTDLRRRTGADDGVALLVAIGLIGLVSVVLLSMLAFVTRETRQTSRDRSRSVSVASAEGAIDRAFTQIQGAAVASLPCSSTTTATDARPEVVTVTTTVRYTDSAGAVLACPPANTTTAAQALIRATSVATPAGGGPKVVRTVESLISLKPFYSTDLNSALYGASAVSVANNFNLYGSNGPNADVYTNGDFSCANNEHIRGSVYAQGGISLANTCTIDVNAWAKTSASVSNGTVLGDVLVSNGNANVTGGSIGGKVRAVTITPASYCTANPGKCVTGPQAAPVPPSQPFPQVNGDDASIAGWTANGYVQWTGSPSICTPAGSTAVPGSVEDWLLNTASTITQPTVVRTRCRVNLGTPSTVRLNSNVALFADGGVSFSKVGITSTNVAQQRYLYFIHPYDYASSGRQAVYLNCASVNPGINVTNLVQVDPSVVQLLYSPCDVYKANNSSLVGQIYSGGTATIANRTDATFQPLPIFGAAATRVVLSYTADVQYTRENYG